MSFWEVGVTDAYLLSDYSQSSAAVQPEWKSCYFFYLMCYPFSNVCVYACVHAYVCQYVGIYVCMYVHIYVPMYICTYVCIHGCMDTFLFRCMFLSALGLVEAPPAQCTTSLW